MKRLLSLWLALLIGTALCQAQQMPDIFSQTYGEKWIRFGTAETTTSAARSNGNDTPSHTTLDISSEDYLWCFVGTAEDYVIYNRSMGDGVALTADGTDSGTPVYFAPTAQARHWMLIDTYANDAEGAGYVITLAGTTAAQGINSYGGKTGFPIKFWKASGAGTHWNFEQVDETLVTYRYTGTNPYPENNYRVAYLKIDYAGTTAYKSLTTYNDGQTDTYFLPSGQNISISGDVVYRGYKLAGVERDESGNLTVNIEADASNKYQYLFYSNSPEGHPYRIPAIAKAYDGTLVAINDYRPCNNDIGYGEVDLVLRRSFDNGETWTSPVTIADGTGVRGTMSCGFGDAALVADRESSRLLLICVGGSVVYTSSSRNNSNYVCRFYSDDNGATWSKPEDITQQIYGMFDTDPSGQVNGLFFGSGRIFQSRIVKKGAYYRLYAALAARPNGNRVIYSDDFGQTWTPLGGVEAHPVPNGDEPKCEELPNGNVVVSSRKSYGRYFNVFHFDDDTHTTGSWGNVLQSNQQEHGIEFGKNACNGEILCVFGKRTDGKYDHVYPIMLQSIPMGDARSNVTIWWKQLSFNTTYNYTTELFAKSWSQGLQVSNRGSAYSTMTLQADNRIGFFYEEEPNNYCMVYVPLSLEEITNGVYRMYDPETDGVPAITSEGPTLPHSIYDLCGRVVKRTDKPGVYIIDGRKTLVR